MTLSKETKKELDQNAANFGFFSMVVIIIGGIVVATLCETTAGKIFSMIISLFSGVAIMVFSCASQPMEVSIPKSSYIPPPPPPPTPAFDTCPWCGRENHGDACPHCGGPK